MKGSNAFKTTIADYLVSLAKTDPLVAQALAKPGKNIDDCCTYILNQVKASGCSGFADEEIYNMALHYYDEDDIKVGKQIDGHVVVNHVVELSAEEQDAARKAAFDKAVQDQKERLKKKKAAQPAKQIPINTQQSLF